MEQKKKKQEDVLVVRAPRIPMTEKKVLSGFLR